MIEPVHRAAWLVAYQLSLLVALVLLPLAVLASRGGLTLPLGRLVERTGRSYAAVRDDR